ncbi:hypothetical protein L829_0925 [Mycobacteroides abscessus MAB_030201_1075]|uniref:Uncharacterized protein n=1 Tax=Mycobacteroides abscessus MAB_030201_1075 TaxID=1335410 RepID=A0A829PF52_9MYCO|nr:hypothetical protein L835_2943 [Mycobacteroides abscessus MAB_110811_1470]ETZ87379.1 hypothetical protein L829_0925 [Mycobacteroides abscessus MAB_030201_1075]ETZ95619.1 hypothetical protein L828_3007 [Mycobacteroides abscessus MAB_030201_1061]
MRNPMIAARSPRADLAELCRARGVAKKGHTIAEKTAHA